MVQLLLLFNFSFVFIVTECHNYRGLRGFIIIFFSNFDFLWVLEHIMKATDRTLGRLHSRQAKLSLQEEESRAHGMGWMAFSLWLSVEECGKEGMLQWTKASRRRKALSDGMYNIAELSLLICHRKDEAYFVSPTFT